MPTFTNRLPHRSIDRLAAKLRDHLHVAAFMLATYFIALSIFLSIAVEWSRAEEIPAIRVLGSGSELSILISSGQSRMLIATGNDATAFDNAFTKARHISSRRLDLLIIAGDNGDLPVANKAVRDLDPRETLLIDGPLRAHSTDLAIEPDNIVTAPITITLNGELTVTISPESTESGTWSAVISYGATTVVAGPDPDTLPFRRTGASTAILTGVAKPKEFGSVPFKLLVSSFEAMDSTALQALASTAQSSFYAFRIGEEATLTLKFSSRGLLIPGSAVRYDLNEGGSSAVGRPRELIGSSLE